MPAIQAFATVARIAEGPVPHQRDRLVAMLDRYIDSMREQIERFVEADAAARRIWELIDLLAANIRGLVAAGLEGTDDFSSLDEWNYVDWLRMNRIAERTLRNPMIRGAHDLGFAYRDGDPTDAADRGRSGDQRRVPVLLHVQGRAVLAIEGRDGRCRSSHRCISRCAAAA